jgi:hypothetical protein
MKKTLILSANYEVLNFVAEKKALKFVFSDKAEIISNWDDEINWSSGRIKHPSILKLKKSFKRSFYNANFTRKDVVRRDDGTCQYCAKKLTPSQITIDHIIPRSLGGINSYTNCVVSCQECNSKKGNNTLEQSGMKLLKRPAHPSFTNSHIIPENEEHWHSDWDNFVNS